jgi:hypothetical protein
MAATGAPAARSDACGGVATLPMPAQETPTAEPTPAVAPIRAPEVAAFREVLEQKYMYAAWSREELAEWMTYALMPDPEQPEGVVNSVYFDTPGLALYGQKRASEYLKFKVRLRWYGDAEQAAAGSAIPCFLEVKRKVGCLRHKQRTATRLPRQLLAGKALDRPEIAELADLAIENRYPEYAPLVPMAHIRYRRRRYIDGATGARVALDWDIACLWFNDSFLPLEAPVRLDRGVLEVKGTMRHLLRSLDPVASLLHKSAFSKYAQCIEKLMNPVGVRI